MTYIFRCNMPKCENDKIIEIVCAVSDRNKQVCPDCKVPLTRVLTAPSIVTSDGVK